MFLRPGLKANERAVIVQNVKFIEGGAWDIVTLGNEIFRIRANDSLAQGKLTGCGFAPGKTYTGRWAVVIAHEPGGDVLVSIKPMVEEKTVTSTTPPQSKIDEDAAVAALAAMLGEEEEVEKLQLTPSPDVVGPATLPDRLNTLLAKAKASYEKAGDKIADTIALKTLVLADLGWTSFEAWDQKVDEAFQAIQVRLVAITQTWETIRKMLAEYYKGDQLAVAVKSALGEQPIREAIRQNTESALINKVREWLETQMPGLTKQIIQEYLKGHIGWGIETYIGKYLIKAVVRNKDGHVVMSVHGTRLADLRTSEMAVILDLLELLRS